MRYRYKINKDYYCQIHFEKTIKYRKYFNWISYHITYLITVKVVIKYIINPMYYSNYQHF